MIQDPFVHVLDCLEARPWASGQDTAGSWRCPGCGRDRPRVGAWTVQVRNRAGPACVHTVRLCAGCVRELTAAGRLEVGLAPPGRP